MTSTRFRLVTLFTLMTCLLSLLACASQPGEAKKSSTPSWRYQPGPVANEPVLDLDSTIRHGDRIVFVGDEMTQQMFYTRAFATGLLPIKPGSDLRIYNAGRDGATVPSTLETIDDLFKLTRPTVVFVALGLNDAFIQPPGSQSPAAHYGENLRKLVQAMRGYDHVRQIILVGPPAVQSGLTPELPADSYNAQLFHLSHAARAAAENKQIPYIDLFTHTSAVYLGQMQVGGTPLTLGGKLPSEEAHTIIASVLLRGIGVTGRQLDEVGFSPLLPGEMGRIRPALAVETHAPNQELANASRTIYETMTRYDEAFFKQWRLAGRHRYAWTHQEAAAQVELAWGNVLREVQELVRLTSQPEAQGQKVSTGGADKNTGEK